MLSVVRGQVEETGQGFGSGVRTVNSEERVTF